MYLIILFILGLVFLGWLILSLIKPKNLIGLRRIVVEGETGIVFHVHKEFAFILIWLILGFFSPYYIYFIILAVLALADIFSTTRTASLYWVKIMLMIGITTYTLFKLFTVNILPV